MKHQVFLLLLVSSSVYSMDRDINRMTKDEFIYGLTHLNYHIKKHYSDVVDVKELGRFILTLRGEDKIFFENHKKELFSLAGLLPDSVEKRELS